MTIPEMLSQSGTLTLLGLGVVFSFLIILIGCMKLIEIVVRVTGLDKEENTVSNSGSTAAVAGNEKSVIAAIAAAIKEKQTR
ncbi:MAG TPA: OadG family protein [Treponema sp.]|nr:OadG family protein [Treponema sp.]